MAVIETWFNQDLQKPVKVQYIDGSMFSDNGNGNRIGVNVYDNGEPVALTGTVSGYAVLSDGSTVPCTGERTGNKASILVPPSAYFPGSLFLTVFLTDGTTVTTLAAVSTSVLIAKTPVMIDPGSSVIDDWTQTINGAMQSVQTAAANLGQIVATPYASLTYPVPLGKFTYYNSNLYRCVSPIASSENFTPAHWSAAINLGDEVSNLKSAMNAVPDSIEKITGNLFGVWTYGYYKTPTDGSDTSYGTTTDYVTTLIPVTPGEQITVNATGYSGTSRLYVFITADWKAIGRCESNLSGERVLTAPENAKYLGVNNKLSEQASGYYVVKGGNIVENFLHDAKVTISSGNVSTYTDCDLLPANQYFVVLANAVTGGFAHAAFDTTHTVLTIGSTTQIAFNVPVNSETTVAVRTKLSNAWQAWQYIYDTEGVEGIALPARAASDIATKYSGHLKNVAENCVTIGGTSNFDDTPEGHSGIFVSIHYGGAYYLHLFYDTTSERMSWGVSSGDWYTLKDTHYDLYPTGDDTPRDADIALNCTCGKTLNLAPGEYYFDTMVIGGHLNGAGMDQTKLIFKDFNSSGHNYALRLTAHGMLTNLIVEKYQASGDITPVEDYTLGQNGIRIEGTGNDDTQRFACTVENVRIKNFEGCGLYIANTGYNPASGSLIHNVRVEFCSCGIFLGTFAEFCTVSDCWANYCYTGHVIMGANNTTSGCDFSMNKIGIAFPDTNGANDSHGIVQCCHIVHTGWSNSDPDWGVGYIIKIGEQQSSEIISNCVFANGKILIKDRASNAGAFFMTGCDFKKFSDVTADNCALNILSSFIAGSASFSVLNGGVIRRRNCFLYNGTDAGDVT